MPIVLYQIPASPPCRAVLMTAGHLGIEFVSKNVDLSNGEQMKPEFLEMNPQHTLPTIDDDGFILYESRAIMAYLINQYAPESSLYPKDPKARATVDKMLNFDLGSIFNPMKDILFRQFFLGLPADPEKEAILKKSLSTYEKLLEQTPYAAGNHITIADYSIVANFSVLEVVLDYSYDEFPRVSNWFKRMKNEIPNYNEINVTPLRQAKEDMKEKMKSKK